MSATEPLFEAHESLIAELRAGTLDAPEHLHRRVLAAGTSRSRRLSVPRGRRLVLVLPVAAALAVGAALVHGAFFPGSSRAPAHSQAILAAGKATKPEILGTTSLGTQKSPAHTNANSLAYRAAATPPTEKKLTAGSLTLGPAGPTGATGSTGANPGTDANSGLDQLATPALAHANAYSAVTIPTNRRVHADASLEVAVQSHAALTAATNKAAQIVAQLGGYAQSVQYQTSRGADGYAFLDLRVPVGKAETAIGRLGTLGKLISQQVATQDLQQTFAKQSSTIGSLKRAIAVYEQALNSGSVTGAQRVEVQIRLSNAEHSLTAEQKSRSHTAALAATADIQLQLTTNAHAFAVGPHKSGRLSRLLGNAADFLGLEGVIVLYALIVAGPIVLVAALGWGLVRERRRRDERRLLASA
ncbi:MAG TPA: DUF4349 domain-containing protein [Gaiellaceae bacterium]|nr:DUF4349 domain-containing protein [Gaiellaceae bacterium]